MTPEQLVEKASEFVHKAYCNWYHKKHGKPYWTNGEYNLLDEETKNADRETTKAVLRIVLSEIQNGGVVNVDMDYQVYLKPDFKKFLNEA